MRSMGITAQWRRNHFLYVTCDQRTRTKSRLTDWVALLVVGLFANEAKSACMRLPVPMPHAEHHNSCLHDMFQQACLVNLLLATTFSSPSSCVAFPLTARSFFSVLRQPQLQQQQKHRRSFFSTCINKHRHCHNKDNVASSSSSSSLNNSNNNSISIIMPPHFSDVVAEEQISVVDRLTHKLRNNGVEFALQPKEVTPEEDCKTLVWKATFGSTNNNNNNNNNKATSYSFQTETVKGEDDIINEDDKNNFFYFCTALRMQDRVDQSLLRGVLRQYKLHSAQQQQQEQSSRRTISSLTMAETHVAESLTGYPTGTIPPFGHTVPLTLIVDSALLPLSHLRTGSGDTTLDLRVSLDGFLQFAQKTSQVILQPITQAGQELVESAGSGASGDQQERINALMRTTTMPSQTDLQPRRVELSSSSVTPKEQQSATNGEESSSVTKKQPKPVSPTWLNKPLAKRLRDVAMMNDYYDLVKASIDEAGEDLPALLYGGVNGNYTKTPVHNAAWRGSPEVLDLFLEAGKKLGKDFLNIIAVGDGNYGKTPIFYALTRSREEMVQHLLDKGATLLIVNNKGQTPCSLAASHLPAELCDRMFRIEEEQLSAGGVFVNYRATHSDGMKYGDLDPRFDIDDNNIGDDIAEDLAQFESIHSNLLSVNGIAVGKGFARSIRQTTTEIRNAMACERWGKTPKLKFLLKQQQRHQSTTEEIVQSFKEQSRERDDIKKPVFDLANFETLKLDDLGGDSEVEVVLVQDLDSLESFSTTVDTALSKIDSTHNENCADSDLVRHSWGVDAEWKPTSNTPVAVLQLCSPSSEIFLLDLQTLCQTSQASPGLQPSSVELFLSVVLTKLFRSPEMPLVGFGIIQDLAKLAFSFPHLPCFHIFESVIDLQQVAPKAFQSHRINSLQTYVAATMKKKLDKTQQCSNWADRPLSTNQIMYAALDAAVARPLLQATIEGPHSSLRTGILFTKHPQLRQTIRMQFLLTEKTFDHSIRHRVPMGHEKTSLGVRFAKQSWPTGDAPPEEPSRVPANMTKDSNERVAPKEKRKSNKQAKEERRKKKAFPLKQLSADLDTLPHPGELVGYTKDCCVQAALGPNVVNSMAETFTLRFNRRGGIVELSNAWLLFINFSGYNIDDWKYRNEFSDRGRQVSFTVDATSGFKENDLPFLYDMGCLDETLEYVPSIKPNRQILLFARRGTDSKFLFCGRCHCCDWQKTDGGKYELQLVQDNYEDLLDSPYRELVEEQSVQ